MQTQPVHNSSRVHPDLFQSRTSPVLVMISTLSLHHLSLTDPLCLSIHFLFSLFFFLNCCFSLYLCEDHPLTFPLAQSLSIPSFPLSFSHISSQFSHAEGMTMAASGLATIPLQRSHGFLLRRPQNIAIARFLGLPSRTAGRSQQSAWPHLQILAVKEVFVFILGGDFLEKLVNDFSSERGVLNFSGTFQIFFSDRCSHFSNHFSYRAEKFGGNFVLQGCRLINSNHGHSRRSCAILRPQRPRRDTEFCTFADLTFCKPCSEPA